MSEPTTDQPPSNTPAPATEMYSSSFSFETPSPSHPRDGRKRAHRQIDGADPSPEDAESKGGRSLRKRTRVDYSFDQTDYEEAIGLKSTPTTSRSSKKRKSDVAFHDDDLDKEAEARVKRRASEQPQSAPRRRGPAKRSTIGVLPAYVSDPQIDDVEVQDTIEVGGHHSSHSDDSPQRRTSTSSSRADSSSSQQNATEDTVVVQETPGEVFHVAETPAVNLPERKAPITETLAPEVKIPEGGQSAIVSHQGDIDVLEHLTPYIDGAVSLYPTIQLDAEPDPEQDVTQDDVAQQEDAIEDAIDAAAVAEDETPAGSPRAIETRANSPAPESDVNDIAPVPKQFRYKQLRSASEFTDLFTDFQSLPPDELRRRLEVVNDSLFTWQEEYNTLKKLTDDEDNAHRYRQEEASYLHRQKMAVSKDPDAILIQKDFVVRGVRAEKPDPYIAYAKQQDRIMANAYLFEYDDRESKIGQQDPIAQRAGAGKGRLRDRPKPTAKAVEADDANVVTGKRTRKAPVLFDGGDATSRGSTPVPAPARGRRRGGQAAKENDDAQPAPPTSQPTPTPQSSQNQSVEQETPKKKGKGGRPRKNPVPATIPEDPPTPTSKPAPKPQLQTDAAVTGEKRSRKRRRKAQDEEEEPAANGTTQETTPKSASRRRNSRMNEIPTGSFYTSSMNSTTGPEDYRPQTASSTATVDTVTSNYQLREKRRTNFSSFNDDDQPAEEEKTPRPKRVRRAPKKIQSEDFAPFHESMPTLAPAPIPTSTTSATAPAVQLPAPPAPTVPKPPTRIKIKTYHPAAPISAPASAPSSEQASLAPSSDVTPPLSANGVSADGENGDNGNSPNSEGPKDYSTMTKSEKMSYSMKGKSPIPPIFYKYCFRFTMANFPPSEMGFRLHEPGSREATCDSGSQEAGGHETVGAGPGARCVGHGPVNRVKGRIIPLDLPSGCRALDYLPIFFFGNAELGGWLISRISILKLNKNKNKNKK